MEPSKRDWKLFMNKIALWQEAYMEKLIKDYEVLLTSDLEAASKFWALEERIKLDKKRPGVLLSLSKQDMVLDIARLIKDDAITMDDLLGFSDELQEAVGYLCNWR